MECFIISWVPSLWNLKLLKKSTTYWVKPKAGAVTWAASRPRRLSSGGELLSPPSPYAWLKPAPAQNKCWKSPTDPRRRPTFRADWPVIQPLGEGLRGGRVIQEPQWRKRRARIKRDSHEVIVPRLRRSSSRRNSFRGSNTPCRSFHERA